MGRLRALDLAKPFLPILPEVQQPVQRLEQLEILVFTACAAVLFAVLSELPLYGLGGSSVLESPDPISPFRAALAASRGTPLELGILPIVLSGGFLQILASQRSVNVNFDLRADRTLFQSAQKLVAVAISLALSVLLVLSGSYGVQLSAPVAVAVVFQLVGGSFFLIMLDEVLEKGNGLGTGILLFPLVKVAGQFAWTALSPVSLPTERGPQTFGVLPSLFWGISGRSLKFAFVDASFRTDMPNLLDLLTAVGVFLAMIYLSTVRLQLPVRSTKMRAQMTSFPVRLLYTNGIPVLLVAAVAAAFFLVSSSLFTLAPENIAARILGSWKTIGNVAFPINGLAYYLSAPPTLLYGLLDPLRLFTFTAFWVLLAGLFGHWWAASSGMAPADISKQFKENAVVLVGKRDVSVTRELKKVIPLAASLGGGILGLIVAVADVFGRAGWAVAMIVGVTNIMTFFELLGSEGIAGPDGLTSKMI